MSPGDVVYVSGAFLALMAISSLPMLGSMRGAGPRQRAALARQLVIGCVSVALVYGWAVLGGFAIDAGGRWFGAYRDLTLVLMGAYFPLLVVGIRAGNRAAAAAQAADRELLA